MILSKEIITGISNLNIEYYKSLGYDAKCNNKLKVLVEHLPKESNLKVFVKCDVCGYEKWIHYQKYTKNISKYNLYTCSVNCAQSKIKRTNLEKYGYEDYVNTEELKKTVKIKYDKITDDIKKRGNICCIKCSNNKDISEYLVKNGRYMNICKMCRNNQRKVRNYKRIEQIRINNRELYRKNIHIYAWRQILRNYINRKSVIKIERTLSLLKYTPEELKHNMESKFDENMNWENYGNKWQIDHIIHVSYFKDETPFYIANSLDNLRPLDKIENISRGNRLDDDCRKLMVMYLDYIKEDYKKLII